MREIIMKMVKYIDIYVIIMNIECIILLHYEAINIEKIDISKNKISSEWNLGEALLLIHINILFMK